MTVLENSINIDAPPEKVWSVLASLGTIDQYDPGITKSEIISPLQEGPGATRRCDLATGGWFNEKVTNWTPNESLSFELTECTLPVRRLKYSYALTSHGDQTGVRQRMEYELKFGAVGKLLDATMVRKKWNAGIKGFFVGLKHYVETGQPPPGKV